MIVNHIASLILNAGKVVIDEIEKAEGEASANNRKAKLIFFYEWVLTLKWKVILTTHIKFQITLINYP